MIPTRPISEKTIQRIVDAAKRFGWPQSEAEIRQMLLGWQLVSVKQSGGGE